jgi:hypothetical protein
MNMSEQNEFIEDESSRKATKPLKFVRRLHMYLGIALVPWFLCYGISAAIFNHAQLAGGWFKSDKPDWTQTLEREYHRSVPADADLRSVGPQMLQDFDLADRSFYAWWDGKKRLIVTAFKFLWTTRLTYFVDQGRVVAEDKAFRLDHFFLGLHERAGFNQPPWLSKVWGGVVDLVGLAVLTWAISGVYVWWKTRRRHLAGGLVLSAGVACFVILVATL